MLDKTIKPTIAMVAQEAGVSLSTVSRILNGTAKVSSNKEIRVLKAIEKFDFKPNVVARSLAIGKTMSIGVMTQYIDSPFFGEILKGIEFSLKKKNYLPFFVCGDWNREEELKQLNLLLQRGVDGIIMMSGELENDRISDCIRNRPTFIVGRKIEEDNLQGIDFDDFFGLGLAVKHLHALNHQSIAFITGPLDRPDAYHRLQGFRETMEKVSLMIDEDLIVSGDFMEESGYQAMNKLLATGKKFTAVIASNDLMAYGAKLAIYRANLSIPKDISLMGFDDLTYSQYTTPPLTTIKIPMFKFGQYAAEAIIAQLENEKFSSKPLTAQLVVRESTKAI